MFFCLEIFLCNEKTLYLCIYKKKNLEKILFINSKFVRSGVCEHTAFLIPIPCLKIKSKESVFTILWTFLYYFVLL